MTPQKNLRIATPKRLSKPAQPRLAEPAETHERSRHIARKGRPQRGAGKSTMRRGRAVRDSAQQPWPFLSRILAQLRNRLPPRYPVDVLANQEFKTVDGDCTQIGRRFRIRLSRSMAETEAIEVLVHEWAHALSWGRSLHEVRKMSRLPWLEFQRAAHGPRWGIAYSLVYRVLVTEILPALRAEDARSRAAQRSQYRRPTRSAAMSKR